MSKIFKPRRGKASTMLGTKSSTVLAAGEMFIELPDTGVGTGICKMKMGDGVTSYGQLPYAMGGDIASTEITGSITEDTSSSAEAAIANVTTGKTLGAIIGSLRRACDLNQKAIKTLNDEDTQLKNKLSDKLLFYIVKVGSNEVYTNANDLPFNTIAYGYENVTNSPDHMQFFFITVQCLPMRSDYGFQIAILNTTSAPNVYVRSKSVFWSSWKEL